MTFRLGYVVLHYEYEELTNVCVENLLRHAPGAQVLVIDNGSSSPFRWRGPTLRLGENRNLAKAMNEGTSAMLADTRVDAVVQLNNDIVVTETTHEQLVWAFEGAQRLGVAAPTMDQEDAGFMYQPCPEEPGPRAEAYLSAHLPRESLEVVPFVDNAAFAIRRRVWEEIGGLEERFTGASWGANYDYCWRARMAGWEIGVVRSAFVFHRQHSTWTRLDPEYEAHAAERMMRELWEVWGDKADQVSHRDLVRRWRTIQAGTDQGARATGAESGSG